MRPDFLPLAVVIDDLDIFGTIIPPHEADPPLIVDPDQVLAGPIAPQSFQSVAGRLAQVLQAVRRIKHVELAGGDPRNPSEPAWRVAIEQCSARLVAKALDHT